MTLFASSTCPICGAEMGNPARHALWHQQHGEQDDSLTDFANQWAETVRKLGTIFGQGG